MKEKMRPQGQGLRQLGAVIRGKARAEMEKAGDENRK